MFGFAASSLLFQSAVNMARSVRLADFRKGEETECQHSQGELERAAARIVDALRGKRARRLFRAQVRAVAGPYSA
eukprot:126328-Pyramimonas_sp.AAC.1